MSVRSWQPSWDDAQWPCGPSATKQQKLDPQAGLMSPAYSMAGSHPAVPTSHRTDSAAREAPGLLGSAPPFPMCPSASNAGARWQQMAFSNIAQARRPPSSSKGDGLLPSPQPGLFPAPFPFQCANGWLPTGRRGVVCQSVKTVPSSESMSVSESENPVLGVSPTEVPALELVIDRIYSDLNALDKEMGLLRSGAALETGNTHSDTGNQILELKKERGRLQNKLKRERERQQIENLQISKQLEQQYNISLGSDASELPHTGRKQNKSTEVPKNRQTEDEASLAALSLRFAKLTCQISDLDCQIEALVSSEDEVLGMQEKQQTLHFLRNQKKALKREFVTVKRSRGQLLKKATEAKFGLDPMLVLKQVAKRVRSWKYLRSSRLNTAQDELQEDVTIDSVEDEDDVIVQIVSSDDSDLDTSSKNPQQQQRGPTCGKRKRYRESRCSERKDQRVERTVRDIEGCVRSSGQTTAVNQSYFMLSALTSVLLARQRHRKSTEGTQQSSAPSTMLQPCALSCLIGEINSKLSLNTRVTSERQEKNVQETVDMYMKIYREPSEVCGQQTKKQCA